MKSIKFDFNNMFSLSIGKEHGIEESEITSMDSLVKQAQEHLKTIIENDKNRINLSLEWMKLPFQDKERIKEIQALGKEISKKFENVIFLGIGGSYLGLKAAQDALAPSYYNEFSNLRKAKPRIYFEGNNLDPSTLCVLLKNLNPKKTFIVVISKSGETTETKAAFSVIEPWLKKAVGKNYGRQIVAITDPSSGTLRRKVEENHSKDNLSFRSLPLLKGVGGRFSEFNMGLLHLAIIGVNISDVLVGAKDMYDLCMQEDLYKNPAYMYALLHFILYRNKNKPIAIMMPFSETLKSTADWYMQLLAESLGKKFARKINISKEGLEVWQNDPVKIVNVGRTPVSARGTNDLHSIQQNNIEGENNKVVTFIRIEKFAHDIKIPGSGDILSGKNYAELLSLAEEATEWALVRENRPSCTLILPEVNPYYWGALLFFFEVSIAFEGELLGINAFDQQGVEGYKNYMYFKLGKAGLSEEVKAEITKSPLTKNQKYIL